MVSVRRWFVIVICLFTASATACGESVEETGSDLEAPETPEGMEASEGEDRELVVVEWEPSERAESYELLRDGEVIAGLTDIGDESYSYLDEAADPGDEVTTPEGVTAEYSDEGIEVNWDAVHPESGPAHDYQVVAVNNAGRSEPSQAATGYRAGATLDGYEVEVDGSGDWIAVDSQTSYIHEDAPLPELAFGEIEVTREESYDFVSLAADMPQVDFSEQPTYRVRAVDSQRQFADPSEAIRPTTEPESVDTEWQRTETDDADDAFTPLDVDCASELECNDTTAPEDGATRHYRLTADARIDTLDLDASSQPQSGSRKVCDIESGFSGGQGTEDDPWVVCHAEHLTRIEGDVLSDHFELTYSIDMRELEGEFEPIESFSGTFDGGGFAIEHLHLDGSDHDADMYGLFSILEEDGRISDLMLTDVDVSDGTYMGALVGRSHGTIEDVHVQGTVSTTEDIISSGNRIGGIVGENGQTGVIDGCVSEVDVVMRGGGQNYVGGVVGANTHLVANCRATGDVNGIEDVGGLVGASIGTGRVETSSASGDVEGGYNVGGLIGRQTGDFETVDSYASGDVMLTAHSGGGLIGASYSPIKRSYSTGHVEGDDYQVGGLVGLAADEATFESTFWDEETSERDESAGGTPLETSDFSDEDNFDGWTFAPEDDHVWKMGEDDDGVDRPRLWWE